MKEKTRQLAARFMRLQGLLLRYKMRLRGDGVPPHMGRGEGIHPRTGQGRILAILKMQPEITQKELGYLLDMSKQALAELLNKLEKNGYVTRTPSEKDRRSFVVRLTDKGRGALPEDLHETNDTGMESFFDCLTDEEQTNLLGYLERIIGAVEEKAGNGGGDDYAEFFRRRFFAKHGGHRHGDFFCGLKGFDPRLFGGGFGGFGFGGFGFGGENGNHDPCGGDKYDGGDDKDGDENEDE